MPWDTRPPYPFDMVIGGVGVRLKPSENGQLVGVRSRQVGAVAPPSYDQSQQNPYLEVPYALGRLTGGMGQAVQGPNATRYKTADGVDCSIGGLRRLGPAFTPETFPGLPAATYPGQNDVRQFVIGPQGSGPALFALVRDRVYRRDPPSTPGDPGTWILTGDFSSSGSAPEQAVWYGPTDGPAALFLATDVGQLWRYDGSAGFWEQAPTAAAGIFAQHVAAVGDQLYAVAGDVLRVTHPGADPMLVASWGGPITVGDHRTRASGLAAVGGVVFVFKWDNVHTVNADGSVNDLFPEFRAREAVSLGRTAVAWHDRLWFAVGDAYYRMGADAAIEPIGPERVVEHGAGVRGAVVSGAGQNDWFFYAVSYDAAANSSALIKYGTWVNPGTGEPYRFADAWHGALKSWPGQRATRCDVIAFDTELNPGLPGPALWVGFGDGSVAWAALPTGSPDPASDPACRFALAGTLDWPDHDAAAPADYKHWRKVAAAGSRVDASHWVHVALALDDETAFTPVGTTITASGQVVVPADPPRVGKRVRVRETLSGAADATPEVAEVVLYEQLRPERLELEYTAVVRAGNKVPRRDGATAARSAAQWRAALKVTAGPGPTSVVFPDGAREDVDFVAYGEAVLNPRARWGLEWDIPVSLVQWRPTPVTS